MECWSCHFLLQRIFPTQGSNPGVPHCREILCHLSHQGSPLLLTNIILIDGKQPIQYPPASKTKVGLPSLFPFTPKFLHYLSPMIDLLLTASTCWRRQWHPTPVLVPGKSHGQRSLVGCSPWGHEESDRTQRLPFHFSLSCIGEGNGNPLQCSCLENPKDGGAWWAAVNGVAQSWT